jgi:hypothetical protein
MPTAWELLKAASQRFVSETKEICSLNLDGTLKSLIVVSAAMQQYHTLYARGAAAKDPESEKFAIHMALQATGYVTDVLVSELKVEPKVTKEGKVFILAGTTELPLGAMMIEEIKTGKPNSVLIVSQIDAIRRQAQGPPEEVEAPNLGAEAKAASEAAIKDVRAALKQELDYTPESLKLVDAALLRVKALIEMGPEHKRELITASCNKYGAYIGEVVVKTQEGSWVLLKRDNATRQAVKFGTSYCIPHHIVEAILEGKSLNMGDASASTVTDFFRICVRARIVSGLFADVDKPGEILKRLDRLIEEAVRIAREDVNTELDFSLFSLEKLDAVIAAKRRQFEASKGIKSESDLQKNRAFTALPLGLYLGEVIRRAHGGAWEEGRSWPVLRQRKLKLDPVTIVGAYLRDQHGLAGTIEVRTAQQYYQGMRPMCQDLMLARLCGTAGNWEALLSALGNDSGINQNILEFIESCVVYSAMEHGVDLDFSEESLRKVDELLDKFYKLTPEERAKQPALEPFNLRCWYGSYTGEVIRRTVGGTWINEEAHIPPQKTIHLLVEGNHIFPLDKVSKFIRSGSAESVAFLLHSFKHILQEQKQKAAAGSTTQN